MGVVVYHMLPSTLAPSVLLIGGKCTRPSEILRRGTNHSLRGFVLLSCRAVSNDRFTSYPFFARNRSRRSRIPDPPDQQNIISTPTIPTMRSPVSIHKGGWHVRSLQETNPVAPGRSTSSMFTAWMACGTLASFSDSCFSSRVTLLAQLSLTSGNHEVMCQRHLGQVSSCPVPESPEFNGLE